MFRLAKSLSKNEQQTKFMHFFQFLLHFETALLFE